MFYILKFNRSEKCMRKFLSNSYPKEGHIEMRFNIYKLQELNLCSLPSIFCILVKIKNCLLWRVIDLYHVYRLQKDLSAFNFEYKQKSNLKSKLDVLTLKKLLFRLLRRIVLVKIFQRNFCESTKFDAILTRVN